MKNKNILLQLEENSYALSNMIRVALYERRKDIFDLLDFEDDNLFLEPSLFCYFLSDIPEESKMSLEQCLWGYINSKIRPLKLQVKSDTFGWVNLPNSGYLKLKPNSNCELDVNYIYESLLPNNYIFDTSIRLCKHPSEHLTYRSDIMRFDEPVHESLESHLHELDYAVNFFRNHLPDFWRQILVVTKEFVVFSSPDHNSFAGIMQHGTAYFNIENKQKSKVFFIDDVAHQCGHIIFNTLTYEIKNYLTVDRDFFLKIFSSNPHETRSVYGAFHGLFTYSSILISLDKFLEFESGFYNVLQHEAIGRIGFYLKKFKHDLELMGIINVYTDVGWELYMEIKQTFFYIHEKYSSKTENFEYTNQPYIFQYQQFIDLNSII
jgi:hypothetical protein